MMKTRLLTTLCLAVACSVATAEPSRRSRACKKVCTPTVCQTSCSSTSHRASGPTTKWFKAKDGTIREVMTHWEALHRAVEADHLEEDLAAANEKLEATTNELKAFQEATAQKLLEMEQRLAAMQADSKQKDQLIGKLKKANQTKDQLLKESKKANNDLQNQLAKIQEQLSGQSEEIQKAKETNKKLNDRVAALKAQNEKKATVIKTLQQRVKDMQQKAVPTKKAQVAKPKKDNKGKGKNQDKPPTEQKQSAAKEQKDADAKSEQKEEENKSDETSEK